MKINQADNLFDNRQVAFVLLISGFFGFCLGLLHSQYQWVVECAQILTGLVNYPPENHFYIFTMKAWSGLNQITALLLSLGISEKALSFFWSGIAGMISFQALAIAVLVLSRNAIFAFLSTFFIFFIHGVYVQGINYPISLMGTDGIYAMTGLSFSFLVIALIGIGRYKLGGLLLGLALFIHTTQGLWCNLVVFFCLIWDFKYHKDFLKRAIGYIILGYSISAASLIYHLLFFYEAPKVSPEILSKYCYALVRYWTEHLMKFSPFTGSGSIARVIISLVLSMWGLQFLKNIVSRNVLFFLRSFIVYALLGGVFSIVYWLPPEKASLYYNLLLTYPGRLFNYNILGSFVLLLGLLGRFSDNNRWIQFNLSGFVIALSLYRLIYPESYILSITPFTIGLMFMSSVVLILSLPPFKIGTVVMPGSKDAWLRLHFTALMVNLFYCFSPFFKGSFFVPFIAIAVSTIAVILSIEMSKKYECKNGYRLLFILEGLCFIIFGFLWSLTKSEHPIFLGKYSLPILTGIIYISVAGVAIILSSYFWQYKIGTHVSAIFKKLYLSAKNTIIGNFIIKTTPPNGLKLIVLFFFILAMAATLMMACGTWRKNMESYFLDWTNDSLYAELYKGHGMVLAGPGADSWLMLRARRPVLYTGGSSILTYAPEAGPEFNHIWQKVYGVDFLNPPQGLDTIKEGLPRKQVKILWEQRTIEEWKQIKKEFGVTNIITEKDWKLNLPVIISNDKLILYAVL